MRWALITVATISPASCAGVPNSQPTSHKVAAFRFGGVNWQMGVADPAQIPDKDDRRLARAKLLLGQGYYEEAIECVRPLMWSDQYKADACFVHGIARVHQGCVSCGEYYLSQAIKEDPEDVFYRIAKVWLHCQAKDFAAAEKEAQEATKRSTKSSVWDALREVRRLHDIHKKEIEQRKRMRRLRRQCVIAGAVVLVLFASLVLLAMISRRTRRPSTGNTCARSNCNER